MFQSPQYQDEHPKDISMFMKKLKLESPSFSHIDLRSLIMVVHSQTFQQNPLKIACRSIFTLSLCQRFGEMPSLDHLRLMHHRLKWFWQWSSERSQHKKCQSRQEPLTSFWNNVKWSSKISNYKLKKNFYSPPPPTPITTKSVTISITKKLAFFLQHKKLMYSYISYTGLEELEDTLECMIWHILPNPFSRPTPLRWNVISDLHANLSLSYLIWMKIITY